MYTYVYYNHRHSNELIIIHGIDGPWAAQMMEAVTTTTTIHQKVTEGGRHEGMTRISIKEGEKKYAACCHGISN